MIRHTERIQGAGTTTIVGLHYLGADPDTTDRILFAGFDGDYRFLFPSGGFEIDGGPSWFPESYYEADEATLAAIVSDVAGDIATWLRTLRPEVERPVVAGASQGGDLSAALALLHPEIVRLATAVAASLPTSLVATAGECAPLRLFHGVADPVVPVATAHDLTSALRAQGADARLRQYPGVSHEVSDQMRADLHRTIESFLAT